MKKICFIINTLSKGGAERVVSLIASKLSVNYEVFIILLVEDAEIDYEINSKVIVRKLRHYKSRVDRALYTIPDLITAMKELDCDVYFAFCIKESIMSAVANIIVRKRLYICERNDPRNEKLNFIYKIGRKMTYPLAQGYIFQTKGARDCYSLRIQNKSYIIPNPIKEDLPKHEDKSSKRICAVGRLTYQKDYPFMIEAFERFLVNHDDYVLEIYGVGPDEDVIKEVIRQKKLEGSIKLCGFSNEVHTIINDCDLFIMTSRYEGMPNALMEAMAMGIPCISSDCPCGGPRTLIVDGENGYLYKLNDLNELVEKMALLANASDLRNQIGVKAKKIYTDYSIETIVSTWDKVIREITCE